MQSLDDDLRFCVASHVPSVATLLPLRGVSKEWNESVSALLRWEILSIHSRTPLPDEFCALWNVHAQAYGCQLDAVCTDRRKVGSSFRLRRGERVEVGRVDFPTFDAQYVSRRHLVFTSQPCLCASILQMRCVGRNGCVVHRQREVFYVDQDMTFPIEMHDTIQLTSVSSCVLVVSFVPATSRVPRRT